MAAIPPLYEVRLLSFHVEAFAKTAVSNAVWITGEWLAQRPKTGVEFSPDLRHMVDVRCWQEALLTLDSLPEELRYRVFTVSFMSRANTGEHLFRELVNNHPQMLREALRAEWARRRNVPGHRIGPRIAAVIVAKELLARLTIRR